MEEKWVWCRHCGTREWFYKSGDNWYCRTCGNILEDEET